MQVCKKCSFKLLYKRKLFFKEYFISTFVLRVKKVLIERANAVDINFKNITAKEETNKSEQETAKQLKKETYI